MVISLVCSIVDSKKLFLRVFLQNLEYVGSPSVNCLCNRIATIHERAPPPLGRPASSQSSLHSGQTTLQRHDVV